MTDSEIYALFDSSPTSVQFYFMFCAKVLTIEDSTLATMFCSIAKQCKTMEQAMELAGRWNGCNRNTILHTGESVGITFENWMRAITIAQGYTPTLNDAGFIFAPLVISSPEFKEFRSLFNLEHVNMAIMKFHDYQEKYSKSYADTLKDDFEMDDRDIQFTIIQYIARIASLGYKTEDAHCQILARLVTVRTNGTEYQSTPTKKIQYPDCMRNIQRIIDGESPRHKPVGRWVGGMN